VKGTQGEGEVDGGEAAHVQQGGCAARGRLPPLERMPLEEAPAERDRHEEWRGGGGDGTAERRQRR